MHENPSQVIARKRAALGLSVEDAAIKAGITRQAWYIIERGTIESPRMDTCLGIARSLECGLADIWTWARAEKSGADRTTT